MNTIRTLLAALVLATLLGACDDTDEYIDHYRYNDGPWVLLREDAQAGVCINWVTAKAGPTTLDFGLSGGALVPTGGAEGDTKFHHVCVEGLTAGETYSYTIATDLGEHPAGMVHSFTLPPDEEDERLSFVVLGDMQPTDAEEAERVMTMGDAALDQNPDFVVQLGDFTHRGTVRDYWHWSFTGASAVMSAVPWVSAMGNHDWGYDDGESWRTFFPYPFVDERWTAWSFDRARSRFIFLDCYEDGSGMSEAQLNWLTDALESAPAGYFTFIFMHGSIFSTGMENMDEELQRSLAPLFDRTGVTAVFYGHDHMYEHYRLTYGANGYLFEPEHDDWAHNEVHYFLSGGGGAWLEADYGLTTRSTKTKTLTMWSIQDAAYTDLSLKVRSWNETRVVPWAPPESTPASDNYYMITDLESYQDHAPLFGHEYGENTLHYLHVTVDATTCTVSARYPDGTLLEGPEHLHPQEWTFTR